MQDVPYVAPIVILPHKFDQAKKVLIDESVPRIKFIVDEQLRTLDVVQGLSLHFVQLIPVREQFDVFLLLIVDDSEVLF